MGTVGVEYNEEEEEGQLGDNEDERKEEGQGEESSDSGDGGTSSGGGMVVEKMKNKRQAPPSPVSPPPTPKQNMENKLKSGKDEVGLEEEKEECGWNGDKAQRNQILKGGHKAGATIDFS